MSLNSLWSKGAGRDRSATEAGPKPGDFPIGSLESRAAARAVLETGERVRLVISAIGQSLDMKRSTCTRTVWDNGILCETVKLHGSDDDLSGGQLEEFIRSHPITG
jgi:hypothetical protein